MLTHKEKTEKIKKAPSNSGRFLKPLPPEEHDKRLRRALEHDNDAGLSSVDEYVFLKNKEANGK